MKILIVYDSVFGNTKQVALVIGKALGAKEDREILHVDSVNPGQVAGLDVLIAGSPTRAFSPTKAIVNFLNRIPANALQGVRVSAFDTRISIKDTNSRVLKFMAKLFGYAAGPMAARLVKKGGKLVIPPEGFFVKNSEGPMKEGELERAADWAKCAFKSE